jgi:pimeloyl-ACP methyl ester carboxylesterase
MTTWVLLRGLIRETRHWGEFTGLFKNAMEEQRVVALDFPGNGSLHAQKSATSVEEMANYCHTRLEELGYPPPYCVLALSMGAMVSVAWSELFPGELQKMVLINTSLAPYNPFYQRLRPANYFALVSQLLIGSAARRERFILQITSRLKNRMEHKQAILDQWIAYAEEYPVTRANFLRQLRAAVCYRAAPAVPAMPVLLLAGQQDQLVNANCSRALAQQWHCAIRLHSTAGHDLPLDDGAWVTRQIKEWVNKPDF